TGNKAATQHAVKFAGATAKARQISQADFRQRLNRISTGTTCITFKFCRSIGGGRTKAHFRQSIPGAALRTLPLPLFKLCTAIGTHKGTFIFYTHRKNSVVIWYRRLTLNRYRAKQVSLPLPS